MQSIEITLPGTPGARQPHPRRQGSLILFETALATAAWDQVSAQSRLEGPVSVEVILSYPVPVSWSVSRSSAALNGEIQPTKMNSNGLAKLLCELNDLIWLDTRQIASLHVVQIYSNEPQTVIRVRPLVAKTS